MSSSFFSFSLDHCMFNKCCLPFPLIFCGLLYFQKCCHRFPLCFVEHCILFYIQMSFSFSTFFNGPLHFFNKCRLRFFLFFWTTAFLLMLSSFSLFFCKDHCIFKKCRLRFPLFGRTTVFLKMSSLLSTILRTTVFLFTNVVFVFHFFLRTTVFQRDHTPTLEVESDCSWGSWV